MHPHGLYSYYMKYPQQEIGGRVGLCIKKMPVSMPVLTGTKYSPAHSQQKYSASAITLVNVVSQYSLHRNSLVMGKRKRAIAVVAGYVYTATPEVCARTSTRCVHVYYTPIVCDYAHAHMTALATIILRD